MRVLSVIALLAALLVLWIPLNIVNASSLSPPDCVDATTASAGRGGFTAMSKQICRTSKDPRDARSDSADTGPRIETVDCGRVKVGLILENSPNHFCAAVQGSCSVQSQAQAPTDPKATTVGFLQQGPSGTWVLNGFDCNVVPGTGPPPPPQVTPFDAYAAVLRLVPSPAIGAAPGKGRTLVNMETIFWVNSAADQSLGPVSLLGHQVGLRIHARATAWAFGDGTIDTSAGLGRPYAAADGCGDPVCAGYFGHTYLSTGAMTVSATVTWAGEFSVDGGTWRGIANPATGANTVDGPAATRPITVIQARGVLVQDPDPSTAYPD
jgi:hypothetical protein